MNVPKSRMTAAGHALLAVVRAARICPSSAAAACALREPCLIREALEAAATPLKPANKSLWGYGVGQAPDGTIWTLYRPGRIRGEATSA